MIYCEIENEGEVDVNAFRLMGATTKNESQIGYFGSGIKYALATALRMGIPIKVFSGEKEIKITTRKTKLRGQEFEVICINGTPTSITTNMGRDWEAWFIFREFYCNALDEGGANLEITEQMEGVPGRTRLYIGMTDEIKDVFSNRDKYFSTRRTPIYETELYSKSVKVYNRVDEKMVVYRKGVRVFSEGNSLFDYDFFDLDINEAREASDWNVKWEIATLWKQRATEHMIASLVNGHDSLEYNMDWSNGGGGMAEAWAEYLDGKTIIPKEHSGYFADDLSEHHILLPHKLCVLLHNAFGQRLKIRGMIDGQNKIVEVPATARITAMVKDACSFLAKSSHFADVATAFPIKIAEMENGTLGQVVNGVIYLSPELFNHGKRTVISALMEEYVHAKEKVNDRTRGMQEALKDLVISTLEEQTGVYL